MLARRAHALLGYAHAAKRHINRADDIVDGRAGRYHGIHGLRRGNDDIQQVGALGGEHPVQGVIDLVGVRDALRLPAVRLGQLHEVGVRRELRARIALVVEQPLPLVHHAECIVVDDEHLHRHAVTERRGHLLDVHLDGAVARDAHHLRVRPPDLGADGRRESEAHRTQATRADERAALLAVHVLVRPHLMLANLGRDHAFMGIELVGKRLEHLLRRDAVGIVDEILGIERPALAPFEHGLDPFRASWLGLNLVESRVDGRDDALGIAHDGHLRVARLADLGRIDVDVNDLRMRRELAELARHAIREARAHRNEEVALGHCHVCILGAVHTHGT